VQVLDARDGKNLWANTYDRDLTAANVFEIQDAITEGVVATIGGYTGVIAQAELGRAKRKPPSNLSALECYYLLMGYYVAPNAETHLLLRSCFEQAVKTDPGFAIGHAGLAQVYVDEYNMGFNTRPNSLDRALASALRAVELDSNSAPAHRAEAITHYHRGELEAFMISAEQVIAVAPHNALYLADLGFHIGFGGNLERGAAMVEKAIALNPNHQPWYHYLLSHYYISENEYDTALDHALRLTWGLSWDFMYRVVIYARSGRMEDARAEAGKLIEAHPTYGDDARTEFRRFYFPEDVIEAYLDTLREVGLDIPKEPSLTN
jgi:tetratricopeptide (TPR) repeat protein